MEGGVVGSAVDIRSGDGRAARIANHFSKYTLVGAFVAVVALIFHVTGTTGPTATADQSVFTLAILIAQVTLPHRQLRGLMHSSSVRAHFESPRYDRRAVPRPAS